MTEKSYMSFTDAAEKLIRAEGKPLSYQHIAKTALQDGLVKSEASDPALSIYVSLRTEIKRRTERNEPQRFVFVGNGLFSLKDLVGSPVPLKTKTALEEVRESRRRACLLLHDQLTKYNRGGEIETMVSDLLLEMGYQGVKVIGGSDDQGVDIVCEQRDGVTTQRIAIQCKCKSLNKIIGPKDVSTLRDN